MTAKARRQNQNKENTNNDTLVDSVKILADITRKDIEKSFNITVSSPIGIFFSPEAIIFSIKVEPHLGTPTIKIGFIS